MGRDTLGVPVGLTFGVQAGSTRLSRMEVATPGRQYINLPQRYLRGGESLCSPTVKLTQLRGSFLML